MVLKGLVGGAVLSIAIPAFAIGIAAGALLVRAPKRQRGCKRCCLSCNGMCQTDRSNLDGATEFRGPSSRSDYSI